MFSLSFFNIRRKQICTIRIFLREISWKENLTIPYGIEPVRILTSSAFVSFFSFLFPHFIGDGRER